MNEYNIAPWPSGQWHDHVVGTGASFAEAVQHTDWFCRRIDLEWGRRNGTYRPHYRYRRYREILGYVQPRPDCNQITHVDIGCGGGLFSWALLDWAREHNLPFNRVSLHGLDHSPSMITLAHFMRDKLIAHIADYPELHYETNLQMLLPELTAHHQNSTGYVITFGHVLAQAQPSDAILNFMQVIVHVLELLDAQSNCVVMAVDAQGWSAEFASSWNTLLDRLTWFGIGHQEIAVNQSPINDVNRAKAAWLSPLGRQEG